MFEIAKNRSWSKKKFREIDLFYFMSFFGLDIFLIFWPTVVQNAIMIYEHCLHEIFYYIILHLQRLIKNSLLDPAAKDMVCIFV